MTINQFSHLTLLRYFYISYLFVDKLDAAAQFFLGVDLKIFVELLDEDVKFLRTQLVKDTSSFAKKNLDLIVRLLKKIDF